jgi:hypothetical protein
VFMENNTNSMFNTLVNNISLFLSHEEKYLILIVLLTLNSNM